MDTRTRPGCGWARRAGAAALGAVLLAIAQAQPVRTPEPGVLLVADEGMSDPRFRQTVLLIIEHDETGSWGLVINRPTDVDAAQMLPDVETGVSNVHFGGPVQFDRLIFIYRDDASSGHDTGLSGVRWSESAATIGDRLARQPNAVRVYAGYAGWAPGQLTFELAHGGWRMIQGRPAHVFDDHPERLWRHLSEVLDGIAI